MVGRRSYHYRYTGSMNAPGSSSKFTERVAQHAMSMLRKRQSDLTLVDNDFFPRGIKQSSTQQRGTSQSCAFHLWIVTVDKWRRRRAPRTRHATCSEICVICTDNVGENDELAVLPCGHGFRRDYLETWLSFRRTCRTCRRHHRLARHIMLLRSSRPEDQSRMYEYFLFVLCSPLFLFCKDFHLWSILHVFFTS